VGNASAQFSLFPLLRDFALNESQDNPAVRCHVAVYVAACKVIDIIKSAKHRRISTQAGKLQLMAAMAEWFELHKVQYSTEFSKPKF
jgi:hypothetical protein